MENTANDGARRHWHVCQMLLMDCEGTGDGEEGYDTRLALSTLTLSDVFIVNFLGRPEPSRPH